MFAILGGLVVTEVNKETRLRPVAYIKRLSSAFFNAANTLMPIGSAFICASIVVAMLNLTGLGIKMSSLILSAANEHLIFALILTMIITIILGMGLPVAASYVIAASVCAPSLIQLGVPLVAAHMFILHFASLSGITPPVALCAYAAAGIGGEKPFSVAVTSCRIGLCAFFVPFAFALGPDLLLLNGLGAATISIIPGLIGAFAVVICVIGWIRYPVPRYLRITMLLGGLCMLHVGVVSDLIGLSVIVLSLITHFSLGKKSEGEVVRKDSQ
jgi:TRAP-type uncharacterized transport system fused permease subunit